MLKIQLLLLSYKIYSGGNVTSPGTCIYEQAVSDLVTESWYNHVVTDEELVIEQDTEYWIGYQVTSVGSSGESFPAGCDAGPVVPNKGAKINLDGSWSNLIDLSATLNYNWNIRLTIDTLPLEHNVRFVEFANLGDQVDPTAEFIPTVKVRNIGLNEETLSVNVIIKGRDNTEVYNNSVNVTLAVDAEEDVECPGINLEAGKIYSIEANLELLADMDISNNQGEKEFNTWNTARQNVIAEEGTGTWCEYCPSAAMGFAEMVSEGLNIAPIALHASSQQASDPFQSNFSFARLQYYGIQSFPTSIFDGLLKVEGGSTDTSLYQTFLPLYQERMAKKTNTGIEFRTVDSRNSTVINCQIAVNKTGELINDHVRLLVCLTESHISYNWQNQTEINDVLRVIYPSAEGVRVEYNDEGEYVYDLEFTPDPTWNLENCELIVFVQDILTKEILQSEKVPVNGYTPVDDNENVASVNNVSISNYPNPFNPKTVIHYNVPKDGEVKIEIYNVKGQLVKTVLNEFKNAGKNLVEWNGTDNNNRNVSSGVYFLKITTNNESFVSRMLLMK